jgi:hypothetical protein
MELHPCCVAIHVRAPDFGTLMPFIEAAGGPFVKDPARIRLLQPEAYGNVFLSFDAEDLA